MSEKLEWKQEGPFYAVLDDFRLIVRERDDGEMGMRSKKFEWSVHSMCGTERFVSAIHGSAKTIEQAKELGEIALRWVAFQNKAANEAP